jgi:hypothetical protein
VKFETPCVNAPAASFCRRTMGITAAPDGEIDATFTTWVGRDAIEPYVVVRLRLLRLAAISKTS